MCFEIFGGGWGGTMKGDGLSASFGLMANSYDTPIEAVELEYPLRVENYNLVTDSGGPGRNRGGLGHYRHTRYLHGEGYYTNRSETSQISVVEVVPNEDLGLETSRAKGIRKIIAKAALEVISFVSHGESPPRGPSLRSRLDELRFLAMDVVVRRPR